MPLIPASAADYATQFQRLLPRGRIWHRGWGLVQDADILALMPTWARLHARAGEVIAEVFPCTVAAEMLPEWEATLGLPDCEPLGTVQQRQAAVCAKFSMRGGQSLDYFIELAAAYGYTIEIETYSAFRVDINRADEPLYDCPVPGVPDVYFSADASRADDHLVVWSPVPAFPGNAWDYAFTVVSAEETYVYFRADDSHADEPLVAWGNAQLECLILKYAPAHTIPMFEYHYPVSIWDAGGSIWDDGTSIWDKWPP